MGRYFGTDGVRGVANGELTPELAFRLGRAAAGHLVLSKARSGDRPRILIGKDPRRSGDLLEAALAAGACSAGVDVLRLGVVPTPAVAWLTRAEGAAAGVMISASHNPAPDNGIKFFGPEGFKLPDADETAIEGLLEQVGDPASDPLPRPTGTGVGRISDAPNLVEEYLGHLKAIVTRDPGHPRPLSGVRLAVDCAHGAASKLAPRLLRELGADVLVIGAEPDGDNINLGHGSTHLEALGELVRDHRLPLGLAFDGDADRLLAVDAAGNLVDGDRIMWLCLRHLKATGALPSADVVATVMSNLGFEEAIAREGGQLVRAKVGDRYVLEEMRARGIRLGGEQSGHLIFLDANTTGDGLVTALHLILALGLPSEGQGPFTDAGPSLAELSAGMPTYPQLLRNVRVARTTGWREAPGVAAALADAEARLGSGGRILVRPSGTEPLIRVMIEGKDAELIAELAGRICAALEEALTPAASPAGTP